VNIRTREVAVDPHVSHSSNDTILLFHAKIYGIRFRGRVVTNNISSVRSPLVSFNRPVNPELLASTNSGHFFFNARSNTLSLKRSKIINDNRNIATAASRRVKIIAMTLEGKYKL
jgi:hypothetical protein